MDESEVAATADWTGGECSDDERYDRRTDKTESGESTWEPAPEDIVQLYEKLARGEVPELDWECPDRRSPSPLGEEESEEEEEQTDETDKEEKLEPDGFDFDEDTPLDRSTVTPRRLGANKTPKSQQKRVASMDSILSDLIRHKKIDREASLASQKNAGGTPRRPRPQQAALPKLTLPTTPSSS